MADYIDYKSSDLEACAAAYRGSLQKLQTAVSTYEQALNALRSDWTGKAFIIMAGKVVTMVLRIKESFDRVTDAMDELGQVQALMDETEQTNVTKMSGLEVGSESPFGG